MLEKNTYKDYKLNRLYKYIQLDTMSQLKDREPVHSNVPDTFPVH